MQSNVMSVAGRIAIAVVLGLIVLMFVGGVVSSAIQFDLSILSPPWGEGCLSHTTMLFVSMVLILIVSKGRLGEYGFRVGRDYRVISMIIPGLIIGIALEVVMALPPGDTAVLELDYNFWQTIVFIWLYASISEEILTRGLVQSFLTRLSDRGMTFAGTRISLPVLVSALFFGVMHLGLLTTGAGWQPVLCTVVFAFFLGLVAGYHRELTGSLIPAIIVHMCGNIGSWLAATLLG